MGSTPPASPNPGDLWWDDVGGQLYVWYDEGAGGSAQWVIANSGFVGPQGPQGPAGPPSNNNILYNGSCELDQAHNGGLVAAPGTSSLNYVVDGLMVQVQSGSGGAGGGQRNVQASPAPQGALYSLRFYCATAQSAVATTTDFAAIRHHIEAEELTDWNVGTASAGTLTFSFLAMLQNLPVPYVFNAALSNNNGNRSYPVELTFTAVGVWQQFVVTIPLDTGGTWVTSGNGLGAILWITPFVGPSYQGTPNVWNAAASLFGTSRNTNSFMTTVNAQIQVTNIKLERGAIATPFVRDSTAVTMARCSRYLQAGIGFNYTSWLGDGNGYYMTMQCPPMRATPTVTVANLGGNPGPSGWPNFAGQSPNSWRIGVALASAPAIQNVSGNAMLDARL